MALMNTFKCQGLLQYPRAGKVCDGVGLLLLKRKDGGAQRIYHYTICGCYREMGLATLRAPS